MAEIWHSCGGRMLEKKWGAGREGFEDAKMEKVEETQ